VAGLRWQLHDLHQRRSPWLATSGWWPKVERAWPDQIGKVDRCACKQGRSDRRRVRQGRLHSPHWPNSRGDGQTCWRALQLGCGSSLEGPSSYPPSGAPDGANTCPPERPQARFVLSLWAHRRRNSSESGTPGRWSDQDTWIVLPIVGMFLFVFVGGVLEIVYLTAIRLKLKRGA